MRIAVYGGSFNPIGNHHIALVRALLETGRYDRVIVVPNGNNYEKKGRVDEAHRLEMCRLACADIANVQVSDAETGQPPGDVHRDVHTIETLAVQFPGAEFDSVRGVDSLEKLFGFSTYCELRDAVNAFVIVPRGKGKRLATLDTKAAGLKKKKRKLYETDREKFLALNVTQPSAGSSSAILRRLGKSQPIDHLVPVAVVEYIDLHKLYPRAVEPREPKSRGPRPVTDPRQIVLRYRTGGGGSYVLDADDPGLHWCARYDATVGTHAGVKKYEPDYGSDVASQEARWLKLCETGSVCDREHRIKINVSSRGDERSRRLSPFTLRDEGFPVPGLTNNDRTLVQACSVENAWQGLKCYPGQGPRLELITHGGKSQKLKTWMKNDNASIPTDSRFRYWVNGRLTDNKAEAVFLNYLPMYFWNIETFEHELLDEITKVAREKIVWLYDTDSSEDISQDKAFSHASILVHYLNGDWFEFFRQFWPEVGETVGDWLEKLPEPYRSELPSLLR